MSTSKSSISRTTYRTATGTLISRLTGLLRLVMIAYALGGQQTADAFNLANNTPNIIHDLVLGGVLAATFVPVFVDRLSTRPRGEAIESISSVITMSVVMLAVATIVFELAAPTIIDLYTFGAAPAAEHTLAVDLLRFFAPQLFFYGFISLMSAVLATDNRFVAVGFAPVVNNLIGIAILAALAVISRDPSVTTLVHNNFLLGLLGLGTTLGVLVQALVLIPSMRRAGIRLRFIWRPRDPAIRTIVMLSGWTFGFVAANQIAVFVILALEFHLGTGRVSAYTYAYTFFQFPFGVVAASIVSVATPGLARAFVAGDLALLGRRFGLAAKRVLAFILPATAGYLVLARPIIELLLQHGAFSSVEAGRTSAVLAIFALGLPGYCIYFLAIRSFQAMQDTRTAFMLYVVENAINILLGFLLYRSLDVQGLALAYTIAYTIAALTAVVMLRDRLGTIGGHELVSTTSRSLVLSLVMALVVAFVSALTGSGNGVLGFARLVLAVGIGGLVYLGGAGAAASFSNWQNAARTSRKAHARRKRG